MGAAIVQGKDMIEAIRLTHLLEINPGGQVKGVPIPNGEDLPDNQVNRLLSIKDMEDLGMEPVRWKEN